MLAIPIDWDTVKDICPDETINFCEVTETEGNYAEVCVCYEVLPECDEGNVMTCLRNDDDQ